MRKLLWADGVAQGVESLPSKHEALSSNQNCKDKQKLLYYY
jgi:hypothetical protein